MPTFVQDLRFGLRLLARDRSFTATALLTLTICLAANTAMFAVVRSVLMKPMPFARSDRAVMLYNSYPKAGAPRIGNGVPDYFDRLTAIPALTNLSVFRREGMTYGDDSGAERVISIRATPSFYRLVGVSPSDGRIFTDEEGEVGKDRKVLLSDGFHRRKFGGGAVVGRAIRLNGVPHDVVGVLPKTFSFLQPDIDIFVPAVFTPAEKSDARRHSNNWQMVGSLAPGATLEQVQQQIDALNAANNQRFPEFRQILADAGFHTLAVMLEDDVVRDVRGVLYLLWGGVLFVLLIGCVNVANLVMVRASTRTREMATRHAIGGNLARLGRQLVTESALLAIAGGALGLLFGWWAVQSLPALSLDQLPRGYEVRLDLATAAATGALAILVGLFIGIAPVVQLWRLDLSTALREDSRGGTSSRRANFVRRALATGQVAMALLLLVGSGLLLASFRAVLGMDFGFQSDGVTTAAVSLPASSYKDAASRVAFKRRSLEAIRALPGVEAAGATTALPFGGSQNSSVILAEGYVMKPGESLIAPFSVVTSEGYFEAMRITLVRGRTFDARDTAEANPVAVIDERLARKFWPDQDPIGRRLYGPSDPKDFAKITPHTRFITVVGVVKDVQFRDPRADFTAVGTYYFPFDQAPQPGLSFAVRTSDATPAIANDIRRVTAAIDPQLPVYRIQPMQEWIDQALVGRRAPMMIAMVFGGVALFLSAVGIYGVLAYSVAQRRRELGVRMALGSSGASVFRLVLREGLMVIAVGVAGGLTGSFFVGRLMQHQLFNVAPMNPVVLTVVTATLATVAVTAIAIPALRASRINPASVLGK
jgi:predicted permease